MKPTLPCLALVLFLTTSPVQAQKVPEAGYIFPPGGKAGTTIDVQLGGYNWTPDMDFFTSDPRVKLVPTGPLTKVLVPEPPYWFGAKGRLPSIPLAREIPAKLTIPADIQPGPIYWYAANANGATNPFTFVVGGDSEVVEDESRPNKYQVLAKLPAIVSGRLFVNEQVDLYKFKAEKDGPITIDVAVRRIGSKFSGILEVRDDRSQIVADVAATPAVDPVLTFPAKAGKEYAISLNDIDFAGDRSYTYRLAVTPGPRIVTAFPPVGKRGSKSEVEFFGIGVATGADKMESIKRQVAFPATGTTFEYKVETPWGVIPSTPLILSDSAPIVVQGEPSKEPLALPASFVGLLEKPEEEHRFTCNWKKGEVWSINVEARRFGSPLDVSVAIIGKKGKDIKELIRNDDLPGTSDAGLDFAVPLDGTYEIEISDNAAMSGSRMSSYRLEITQGTPDFSLKLTSPRVSVPIGGKFDLAVKAVRRGGFKEPIKLKLTGLPAGVTPPEDLVIPGDKSDLVVSLKAPEDAGTGASLVTLEGSSVLDGKPIQRIAKAATTVHLITRGPEENQVPAILVAATMKARFKGKPVDSDTVRKVPRGATHPAEVIVERLDGFDGEITLQMSSTQSYQMQGITGGEAVLKPGETKALYPCFMPEWLESTRTSRMGTVAVAKVKDPKGRERVLMGEVQGYITMTMEGALMKISNEDGERTLPAGKPFDVHLKLARVTTFTDPAKIELITPKDVAGQFKAETMTANAGQDRLVMRVTPTAAMTGLRTFSVRATAMQEGKYAVVTETPVTIEFTAPGAME